MRQSGWMFGAALAAAIATSCVLVISPLDDVGFTCGFRGQDATACGACIANACQIQISACCADRDCSGDPMSWLDSCASGTGCTKLLGANGKSGEVAACVRTHCAAACRDAVDGGDLKTTCVEYSDNYGARGCQCDAVSPFEDAAAASDSGASSTDRTSSTRSCDSTSFSGASGACCAFNGWPNGGSCVCLPVRCETVRDNPKSCVCGLYANGADFEASRSCSRGQPCCAKTGSCACNEEACTSDEQQVSYCSADDVAATIGCEDGGRVTRCL